MPPGIRAERALATRRRMVAAAYRVFCESGYLGATMTAVAEEADVAVQTLYYTFHTKAQLLGEALGAAVVGFDDWQEPPPEPIAVEELVRILPWWDKFTNAATTSEGLKIFVRNGVDVLARAAPLVAALHGSAGDPDAVAVVQLGEQRRVDAYREAVRALARKEGGLRAGLKIADATDIVVVLFSAEVYQGFANGRGWSRARCQRFFEDTLASQLL